MHAPTSTSSPPAPARWAGAAARTVYRLHERVLGRPTFAMLDALERSQWRTREQIEQQQLESLRRLLQLAHAHCPWHRRRLDAAGLDPRDLSRLSDLQRLPCMSRAEASAHGAELVWQGVPGGAQRYNTGGSSGQPLIFHFGRRRQASDAACRMRARRWWGVAPGEREAYLWGAPVELARTDRIKTLRDRLVNQIVLNAFAMAPPVMDGYLDALESFAPRCLYGYASSLALLAAHARARGRRLRLPALRVVCTTGEPLYPHQRALVGEVFGAAVANEFGSRDIGFTAHESPGGQMLLLSEHVLLEVLDAAGRPVPVGEAGEAVMTGLCSDAQPFIRYRSGDVVRLSPEPERTGRGLHVIAEVVGRRTDFLVRPDGTIMHALAGIYVLRAVAGVAEFKLVQHSLRELEVLVVANAQWRADAAGEIGRGLRRRMGDEVRVNVRVVEAIAPEASGKHRYVVSHVALHAELAQASAPH